jgi:SAM-dependent methyltransferase
VQKKSKSSSFNSQDYLMESEDEAIRLDVKTDPAAVRRQALWCGVKPGMRILDAGCGPGKTTALLHEMLQPGGSITGVDFSENRIAYAKEHYGGKKGIEFYLQDLQQSMEGLGEFDLIWVRFVLEYYRKGALDIVKNLINHVKPGGRLCLLDLDYNCLNHYELPAPIAAMLPQIMKFVDEKYNFDTFAGRKLYSFLYDNGFEDIDVELMAHNLIYGKIKDKDKFNLMKKVEISAVKAEKMVKSYPGGYRQFYIDLEKYLVDHRRFTYTPLILCKGIRPLAG